VAEIRASERLVFSSESLSLDAKVSFSNGLHLFADKTCQDAAHSRECGRAGAHSRSRSQDMRSRPLILRMISSEPRTFSMRER
jgi:hypothetical protein